MKTLILAAVAAFAISPVMAEGHGKTVRLGTEGAYPPYNFLNDDGEVAGFEREVGDELCNRAGLTCEWVKNDWDSIIPNLVSGNYDTIIAGMSITAERAEVVAFSQNYLPPAPSAYAATDDGADLTGGVIAAQTGTIQANHVVETGANLLEFPTPDETVAAVKAGEADAVLADKDFLVAEVENSELMFVGDDVFLGDGIGMAFRQSDTEMRDKFDAAIASMKADGSLNVLIAKWFGEDAAGF